MLKVYGAQCPGTAQDLQGEVVGCDRGGGVQLQWPWQPGGRQHQVQCGEVPHHEEQDEGH